MCYVVVVAPLSLTIALFVTTCSAVEMKKRIKCSVYLVQSDVMACPPSPLDLSSLTPCPPFVLTPCPHPLSSLTPWLVLPHHLACPPLPLVLLLSLPLVLSLSSPLVLPHPFILPHPLACPPSPLTQYFHEYFRTTGEVFELDALQN
ncbi:hypothetical protein Pmani_037075 [Petrolisthes manimaculis]|uniref:Uncharacterized protein n=1 Tax=Petrolisthes manimaculis TaxID=1843537 RepID=A0AAE1TLI2_9EUCA|nr:hypothetical protein Pmani_037075 [Petrolisthes manimaculis]